MLGTEPLGTKATVDSDRVLAIDCDCVIYTPRDYGNYHTDEELLRILRAGRNVVTALPNQHAHLVRGEVFMEQLREACAAGKSIFHATGVDPDLISDRVLVALTGLCNDVKYLKLQENWDFNYTPPDTLALCGFGKLTVGRR